jgi:two-component system sensor histidine kinase/response regulator
MNQGVEGRTFDLTGALDRLEQDKELLIELVQLFSGEYPQQIAQLEQHVRAADKKQIEATAHSMKSALGNIGADAAFRFAASIERAAREGSTVDFSAQCSQLRALVAAFQQAACDQLGIKLSL